MFDEPGFIFWPVGTGDSTSIVIDDETIFQVDLRHLEKSEDDADDHVAIVDRLVEELPKVDGSPYLAAFGLTHPDKDHIQGFEELLDRVVIGELWFTPRIFREYHEDLCDDAVAFKKEADRRIAKMIETGGNAEAGDRLRLIGYDELLEEEKFEGFPPEYLTVPGNAVTELDGADRVGAFRAFIHAPFKDDSDGERNDTSLAMQVVLSDDPSEGGALLFGDLKYPTIRKIFDVSKAAGNEDNLAWKILLAPHHCSKSVMYQDEGGSEVLKQDILDDFEAAQVGDGFVVASSEAIPAQNKKGDNPPHAKAKARYEEIVAGDFLCTHEDGEAGEPLTFNWGDGDIVYEGAASAAAAKTDTIAEAIDDARGGDAPPSGKVGFGR
ncbi:MAG: hypothetical protein DHS20C05_24290 [Hyphococcus sp.]|nr:MAG: hypothetical protein DHS20C05_24290 [Marinicaulis sp.]